MNIKVTREEAHALLSAIKMYGMNLSEDFAWTGDPDDEEELRNLETLANKIRDLLITGE